MSIDRRDHLVPPRGVICPLATPLNADETVDEHSLTRLIARLVPEVDGFLVLGTSSEYNLLTPEAIARVLDVAVESVPPDMPMYVGVSDTGTTRVKQNIERIGDRPINGIAVTAPYYFFVSQRELYEHFVHIADFSPFPIVVYNIPQNTGNNIDPETLSAIAQHGNVIGVKDSAGDVIQFLSYLELTSGRVPILQGREELVAVSMWSGAQGVVSALANLAPQLLRAVLASAAEHDREATLSAQRAATAAAAVFREGHWLAALKSSLSGDGFGDGTVARPLSHS